MDPLPRVRPLQDGDLRDRLGRAVGVPVACLDDSEAVAGLDAAIGDRERGVEGDPLAAEHFQRDGAGEGARPGGAAGRVPRRRTVSRGTGPAAVGIRDGERRGDITDRRVGGGGQHQVGRALGAVQCDLELHRYAPPAITRRRR